MKKMFVAMVLAFALTTGMAVLNGHGAQRSGSCGLQHRKLLIQTGGRHDEREFTSWKNVCEGREF
jgi:hypothetical protein